MIDLCLIQYANVFTLIFNALWRGVLLICNWGWFRSSH